MLIDFAPRPYQTELFKKISSQNSLLVLPTGLGKTAIAMMLAAKRLLQYPEKKIVFLAPTKPLVEQQYNSFKKQFQRPAQDFGLCTGGVSPQQRKKIWEQATFIFSTPQTLENDILSSRYSFEEVCLLVLDEAHRGVGDYAYVFLAKKYVEQAQQQRILAMTASPATDEEKIKEVMAQLYLQSIVYKKPTDPELKKYTQHTAISWEYTSLPSRLQKTKQALDQAIATKIKAINQRKQEPLNTKKVSKTTLLRLQHMLHARIAKGETTTEVLQVVSLVAEVLKLYHAVELVETQSVRATLLYMQSIIEKAKTSKTKAVKNLARDPYFLQALAQLRECRREGVEHPKVQKIIDKVALITQTKPNAKVLVFTQFRESALLLHSLLSKISFSAVFFGQAKKNGVGFSQKKQKEVLEKFRANEFSCLIATSVAEEGLDIPSVDHVFFYEPVPSAIRSVQRRGRTGRHSKGFVTVFVTKNTRDEVNRWVAFHKEKRMYQVLEKLSNTSATSSDSFQHALTAFTPQKTPPKKNLPKIIVDHREKGSPTLKSLFNQEVNVELHQLEVGDFLLSKDCCVEFKNVRDFIDSIADNRLLIQLRSLAQYKRPLFVLEGDQEELFSSRKVSQKAIHGMLATITVSYGIAMLRTSSPFETAQLFSTIAHREQRDKLEDFTFHAAKPLTEKEQLEYVVASLPGVGISLAKALLQHFDSLSKVAQASQEELQKVPLIGKKKAKNIYDIFRNSYEACSKDSSFK